jgi:hypothetical protein
MRQSAHGILSERRDTPNLTAFANITHRSFNQSVPAHMPSMDDEVQKLVNRGKTIGGVIALIVIVPILLITILAIMVVAGA